MKQWSFEKILYFLKVAEKKSFSEAARELYLTPQALNKQVTQLEETIGETLFIRNKRGLQLTAFGEGFYKTFYPIRKSYYEAINEIVKTLEEGDQCIDIKFFHAISKRYAVVPIVKQIEELIPGVCVKLNSGELDDVVASVRNDSCNLGITNIHDYDKMDEFDYIPLLEKAAMVVVSNEHPLAQKDRIAVEDLEQETILLLKRRDELAKNSFYRKVKARKRLECSYFPSMIATLELGKCYAVMPRIFENMESSNFKYLELPEEYKFNYQMVVFFKKDNPHAKLFANLRLIDEMLEKIHKE